MYPPLDQQVHAVSHLALFKYKGHLEEAGLEDTSGVELTGRWIVHSGIFGSSDGDPTFVFEVVDDGENAWINEAGLFMGDGLDEYFNGVK